VAITNGYATLANLKDSLRIETADTADDALLERAIESASRQIDQATNRRFWQDGSAVARYYTALSPTGPLAVDDFATTTGLLVATDDDGTVTTFETSWTIDTDFVVEPLNAAADSWPWTSLAITWGASKLWPTYRSGAVKVTAKWGWAAVPKAVEAATLIQAGRLFSRRHSPSGVAGWQDSPVLVPWRPDPDVERLIAPYRRPWGAV
jgi:hypothetical protein